MALSSCRASRRQRVALEEARGGARDRGEGRAQIGGDRAQESVAKALALHVDPGGLRLRREVRALDRHRDPSSQGLQESERIGERRAPSRGSSTTTPTAPRPRRGAQTNGASGGATAVDTCLCGLLFFAFGFAFMFSHGNGFIG